MTRHNLYDSDTITGLLARKKGHFQIVSQSQRAAERSAMFSGPSARSLSVLIINIICIIIIKCGYNIRWVLEWTVAVLLMSPIDKWELSVSDVPISVIKSPPFPKKKDL